MWLVIYDEQQQVLVFFFNERKKEVLKLYMDFITAGTNKYTTISCFIDYFSLHGYHYLSRRSLFKYRQSITSYGEIGYIVILPGELSLLMT